ncbi:proto-oncogene tyrosine-protein kinase receptor Ret-like [Branchiostoma floridae]|uniref:Proto-oncogene tyrosine-protein kinase receptor Ret-like n=3 Tax=Branchiostoma floridae TaxID=7739 RepID=A0A9J7M3F4_BRAFL|nr:proto-oncogene tyrosine-protein kinase receptor Ret-like [Branchiostoma floridae]
MASILLVTLLLGIYPVLSGASLPESCSFNVSVPENAAPGTEVVDASCLSSLQKAKLPCVKTEGDPYGRFLLTKECALVVANPLDWSVRSEYTIKIRVGDRREVRSVSIQVTDVPGYPPVYNETCETPINPTESNIRYKCKVPKLGGPVRADRPQNPTQLVHVQSADVELIPQGCPVGKYGFLCDQDCICKNGARCHGFNGACKCQHGWQGVACDIPKPDIAATTTSSDSRAIYISANVTIQCRVYNIDVDTLSLRFPNASVITREGVKRLDIVFNAELHDNGPYTCQAIDKEGKVLSATIVLNVNCPPNRKGKLCDEACDCVQGTGCDRWTGCVCPPGFSARKTCDCNGGSCSHTDGKCACTAGWYGSDCRGPCPKGRYGWRCRRVCSCKNNATCHHVDGNCTCAPPWGGRDCDELRVTQAASLLEILVPLSSIILVVIVVLVVLYKTGCSGKKDDQEAEVLRELRRVEEDLAQSLQPGWLRRWEKKIRHLTPGDLIGQGKFGDVIQAQLRTPKGKIVVAAKTVRQEDAQSYRDFYREAAILVVVHEEKNHDVHKSNIVQLLGIITANEKYLLLEYCQKGDLLWVLHQFRCGEEDGQTAPDLLRRLLRYAVHVARALGELERLRIVHRDVAARNVLITVDDMAKLADFGLARDVYTADNYVSTSHKLLPLKWMTLESIETGEYTCQSDVWSFGVLLWEIATLGKDPCYGDKIHPNVPELAAILAQGIRLPRPPGCPEGLYGLMRACWRRNPAERPGPDALEKWLVAPYEIVEIETAL